MSIFSILLLIFSYLQAHDQQHYIYIISQPLQNFCNSLLSDNMQHVSLYRAVACGATPDPQLYTDLKKISLWHLLVVSGGHFTALAFILDLLKPIKKHPALKFIILIFFCFWTGFQEPAVLAFVFLVFQTLQKNFRLNISDDFLILYSGASCLLLFPNWSISFSFLLSWLCRISILITQSIKSAWIKGLAFYLLLIPVCFQFGTINSLQGILWNCLFGTALSFILFPLATLLMLAPETLGPGCDALVNNFLFLVKAIAHQSQFENQTVSLHIRASWSFVCVVHMFYFFLKLRTSHELSKKSVTKHL